jgi:ADP-ribosylglycohydrolase
MQLLDRYKGALLGLAAGDALGTTVEFNRRGTFPPMETILGGGPFRLAAGQWTDDTSMALCLAESLLENGFDADDQMRRYVRWWREGYWSSTGHCFDIGTTTRQALARFEQDGNPLAGSVAVDSAGNGSLMRLAPVPLRFAKNPALAVQHAAQSSRTTHGAADAVDACRYFACLIIGALRGVAKTQLLSPLYAPPGVDWNAEPLSPPIASIAFGSYKRKSEHEILSTGYVAHTLEAALWAFNQTDSFADGARSVVNLGDDADTAGAVYGQLAGAFYGVDGIPREWRDMLHAHDDIVRLAASLFDLGAEPGD